MTPPITHHTYRDYPDVFQLLHKPPKRLYCRGPWISKKEGFARTEFYITVVGSRSPGVYGTQMCEKIIKELRNYPIVIVSGLAKGIDSIAHQSALRNNLRTISFPGSGIIDSVLYPKQNRDLAHKILMAGGSLISPYPPTAQAKPWMFPARNHLMAALSDITLVIESAEKSGTLITAYAALEYGREVSAIPGPINSNLSAGTNTLIKKGAHLIQSGADILDILNL